ncbi:MAG: methylmalonyl Co-A mutase-associated GTPase MeaB [Cyclobacteriaceae bacterium]
MNTPFQKVSTVEDFANEILSGNRFVLSRAITLSESKKPTDRDFSNELLNRLLPATGNSVRIGITGIPGVGKSTFIDAFGTYLTNQGKKLAVLSIDPSSKKTKGSILGDKTRMAQLSNDVNAFIRPSPSGNHLGGVAQRTRETMLLCEAAGFDVIIIETVGVGQSETAVKDMVDVFLLLMLSGGGDELQGIKRGIMEMTDIIAINKVDGDNVKAGQRARQQYEQALHLFPGNENGWTVPVMTTSAIDAQGLEEIWIQMEHFFISTKANGWFDQNRNDQKLKWFKEAVRFELEHRFYDQLDVKSNLQHVEDAVQSGKLSVRAAIDKLMK